MLGVQPGSWTTRLDPGSRKGSPVMNVDGFLCDTGGSGLSVRR